MTAPTVTIYTEFQRAFDHFNFLLFDDALPPVLLTMSRRKKRAMGYFAKEAFEQRKQDEDGDKIEPLHEICMNPDYFRDQDDEEVLSTLVHEMAHHWQNCFGDPGKNGYHNREWADKMVELGLKPVSFDNDKGTGTRVSHTVIPYGRYQKAFQELEGFSLEWAARLIEKKPTKAPPKLACPGCGQKVQGSKDSYVLCGHCNEKMIREDEIATVKDLFTPLEEMTEEKNEPIEV